MSTTELIILRIGVYICMYVRKCEQLVVNLTKILFITPEVVLISAIVIPLSSTQVTIWS